MKASVLMMIALAAMVPFGWQESSSRLGGTPSVPGFEIIDQAAFERLFARDAAVWKLASGFKFAEGPVWMTGAGAAGYLVFSDVPANEMKRWDATDGVRTFRAPSGSANGNTRDRDGRLLTAEHAGRISRTDANGAVVTLVDAFEGKRLNSPNDVIVSRDGSVWFTDPAYGLAGRKQETPGNYVYRLTPVSKALVPVVTDLGDPNGLCLSPDEQTLYVANSAKPPVVRAYPVTAAVPFVGRAFATIDKGVPDGIRCDALGNVWSSAGDGVQIFDASGARIGRILLPETAANLAFGGQDVHTVYITASSSLYAVDRLLR
jgi:gluconolactonase